MNDLLTWGAEHSTTLVALGASVSALIRSRAIREEAAAKAVAAVVKRMEAAEKKVEACEVRERSARRREDGLREEIAQLRRDIQTGRGA